MMACTLTWGQLGRVLAGPQVCNKGTMEELPLLEVNSESHSRTLDGGRSHSAITFLYTSLPTNYDIICERRSLTQLAPTGSMISATPVGKTKQTVILFDIMNDCSFTVVYPSWCASFPDCKIIVLPNPWSTKGLAGLPKQLTFMQ